MSLRRIRVLYFRSPSPPPYYGLADKLFCSGKPNKFPELCNGVSEWKREDVALVVACDGLYDALDDQLVAEIACPWMSRNDYHLFNDPILSQAFSEVDLKNGCKCMSVGKGYLAELAAARLRSAADALDSMDNISIIVIML
jgi:serine/threonine protein phosphatase PrpC